MNTAVMKYLHRFCAVVIGATLVAMGGAASAQDGIKLRITNDGIADIFVTVYDANVHRPIIEHQRLNGFAQLPITASADAKGLANISWTAISVDDNDRHCGRGHSTNLENAATVNVHADSSC